MWIRIVPYIFSFLLLAAHFLRYGNFIGVTVSLLIPMLLLIRKPWVPMLTRWLAYGAAAVWLRTTYVLVRERISADAPWLRLVLILAGVILVTVWAGYLVNSTSVKRYYQSGRQSGVKQP